MIIPWLLKAGGWWRCFSVPLESSLTQAFRNFCCGKKFSASEKILTNVAIGDENAKESGKALDKLFSSEQQASILHVLNTASKKEPEAFKLLGGRKSINILEHREKFGPFQNLESLVNVPLLQYKTAVQVCNSILFPETGKKKRKSWENQLGKLIKPDIERERLKFDPGNMGYISSGKFQSLLESHSSKLDPHKREVLLALADSHADRQICYQDFVNLMSNKRSNSFRQAILQGNRRLSSKALLEEKGLSLSQRLIRHVAYETLPREIDRKWYYDSYTCCPPPWFIITVTLLEVAFFLYNGVLLDQFVLQVTHPHYLKNSLVYHPQLRAQAWRYLTYIFMHAGIEHLGLNVVLQLLVGVPLEMVHGATRIGLVYVTGVVAGSLAVSVADMTAPVVGSSGGVYALISAHLANIVMNWSGMKCQFKLLRMAVALICMSMEFGRAVWLRFHPSAYPPCPHPSFVAHLGGVAVGITLGVVVLRNYEQRLQDQSLWWIFVAMYTIFVLFAIFWNIFAYTLLDLKLPPPP